MSPPLHPLPSSKLDNPQEQSQREKNENVILIYAHSLYSHAIQGVFLVLLCTSKNIQANVRTFSGRLLQGSEERVTLDLRR